MAIELNGADFHTEMMDSNLPVWNDFRSEQCAPCKNLMTVLDQLAEELAGRAKVVKLDAFAYLEPPACASRNLLK